METPKVIEIDAIANVHSHLREGSVMIELAKMAVKGGADIVGAQPNTDEGLVTASAVLEYKKRMDFFTEAPRCLPFLQITEETTESVIHECIDNGIRDGKVYPLDRTTSSRRGVRHYGRMIPIVRCCGNRGMRVHFHPEHPWMIFENRDAEFAFLPIAEMFLGETEAVIFWEHGSDARCIPFWIELAKTGRFFVTLTAHHLASDENEAFGDVRSVCKPAIKTRRDGHDLRRLVADDRPWVMAGADDAPHDMKAKQPSKGRCACGAYTAPFLAPLYAHALDDLLETKSGLRTFVNFTSENARRVFILPKAARAIHLLREPMRIPHRYTIGDWEVMPFMAGQELKWRFA